jgi:hypothetical protein
MCVEFCSSHHVPEYANTKVLCGPHWNFITHLRTHFGKFTKHKMYLHKILIWLDRLCGLVVRVLGYISGGPGSIPGTNRKKKFSGSGTGCTQPREYKLRSYLIEK